VELQAVSEAIRVEAPNALLGFLLVQRLQHVDADVVPERDGGWTVEVPPDAPREWVLATVQEWADDEALNEVVVHMDGATYAVVRS
jgi:hypothetical protein